MCMENSDIIINSPSLGDRGAACRARYTGCPNCGKALSIAEVIERHCETCGRQTNPKEMRQPSSSPLTDPDSLTPP
nr:endonuclease Q family protein [Rhizobium leguminosarum]